MDQTNAPERLRKRSLGVGLKTMLVLVATCGLVFWSFRAIRESNPILARIRSLQSSDVTTRIAAIESLGNVTTDDAEIAIPALIQALSDSDAQVRAAAVRSVCGDVVLLSRSNPKEPFLHSVQESLIRTLKDSNPTVRTDVVQALGGIAALYSANSPSKPMVIGNPQPLLDALIPLIQDPSTETRVAAVQAIGALSGGTFATGDGLQENAVNAAVLALLKASKEDEPAVRDACYGALQTFGRDQGDNLSAELVPTLIDSLSHPDMKVRSNAAWILGFMGRTARPAIPALFKMLKEPYQEPSDGMTVDIWSDTGSTAGRALGKIVQGTNRVKDLVDAMIGYLQGPKVGWRHDTAAVVVEELDPKDAEAALPALIATLKEPTNEKSSPAYNVFKVVGKFTAGSKFKADAIDALTNLLDSPSENVRRTAGITLGEFGRLPDATIKRLRELSDKDPSPYRRQEFRDVLLSLEKAESESGKATPVSAK